MRIEILHTSDWGCERIEGDEAAYAAAVIGAVQQRYPGAEVSVEERHMIRSQVACYGAASDADASRIEEEVLDVMATVWDRGEFWDAVTA